MIWEIHQVTHASHPGTSTLARKLIGLMERHLNSKPGIRLSFVLPLEQGLTADANAGIHTRSTRENN